MSKLIASNLEEAVEVINRQNEKIERLESEVRKLKSIIKRSSDARVVAECKKKEQKCREVQCEYANITAKCRRLEKKYNEVLTKYRDAESKNMMLNEKLHEYEETDNSADELEVLNIIARDTALFNSIARGLMFGYKNNDREIIINTLRKIKSADEVTDDAVRYVVEFLIENQSELEKLRGFGNKRASKLNGCINKLKYIMLKKECDEREVTVSE